MSHRDSSISVPLRAISSPAWGAVRRSEPLTIGVPLPRGAVRDESVIGLLNRAGLSEPVQARALERWPDGSVRWVLLDFAASTTTAAPDGDYTLQAPAQRPAPAPPTIDARITQGGVCVSTGPATFTCSVGGAFPLSDVSANEQPVMDAAQSGFRVEHEGRVIHFVVSSVQLADAGPLRAEVHVGARSRGADATLRLEVFARVELFAGSATARVALTIRNPRRAAHPGGIWVLGDAGSVCLQSAVLALKPFSAVRQVRCAAEPGMPLEPVQQPFEVYQESSGGEQWQSRVHVNRRGDVPLRFRGYRFRSNHVERSGLRANPIVTLETGHGEIAVTLPQFWQNFPRALAVKDDAIEIGFFPRQAPGVHELQGGEQKTHVVVVAFAQDAVSDPPLAWCHDPLRVYPSPDWCCGAGAVPYVVPESDDPNAGYLSLVHLALDGETGFAAKREVIDEYGWRNFGDLYADHESAFQPPGQLLASHYNNQYDALAGFATHFLRSGDARWWQLMIDLAQHVRDIDIYHTTEDKAAYNGGMFWHTDHYRDAGASTHRTYPPGSGGGGPSAEHNYNTGLMLHYFMTGDPMSREAAIGLGRWVIDMDDGGLTPFRWLARGPTGLASASGSMDYHGPGRGAANSVVACLVAYRLTADARFEAKADQLIQRCIHPSDDVGARNLFDVERRWFYTVFLQALTVYIIQKAEASRVDAMYAYALASLRRYAEWMEAHERPYLEHPERLEYPTETWAAQDLRKADVLLMTALLDPGGGRDRYLAAAARFFRDALGRLATTETRHYARPVTLLLVAGVRFGSAGGRGLPAAIDVEAVPGAIAGTFVPQKRTAIRRAQAIALAGIAVLALLIAMATL